METLHGFIQAHSIFDFGNDFIFAYFFIIIDKLPRIAVVLLGASATVILGILSQEKGYHGNFDPHYFVNYIDFNVIFLLVSMMIIVNITARSGVFNWMANELLKFTKGEPKFCFISPRTCNSICFSIFRQRNNGNSNYAGHFCYSKKTRHKPDSAAYNRNYHLKHRRNGNPHRRPSEHHHRKCSRAFLRRFLMELTGIIVIILSISIGILAFIFRKDLETTPEKMQKIEKIDNSKTITDKKLLIRSTTILTLVILGFLLHSIIHLEASVVAMAGAAFLLLFEKPEKEILHKVEWNTIFFFIGLFIIIGGLEASGGIAIMANKVLELTQGSQSATAMVILWASGILSGLIDNIPYTVTMTPMLLHIQNTMGTAYAHPLWWCLSLGACLGGNLTIIGAAANVIVSETAASAGHHISFTQFMKYGLLITFISLTLSSVYIYFRFLV